MSGSPEDSADWRWKQRALGLCIACSRPRSGNRIRCVVHSEQHRQAATVRRRELQRTAAQERIPVELRCTACGATQTEPLRADAIMVRAVARVKCASCGTRAMAREPRKRVG